MTWPFENDTSAITKKLANRSIKADKRRNIFIIVTIAFAACLMTVLALYTFGKSHELKTFLQGRYQAAVIDVDLETINDLRQDSNIEMVGTEALVDSFRVDDYTLNVNFRDSNNLYLYSTEFVGNLPDKENEVAVSEAYLKHIGVLQSIGLSNKQLYKMLRMECLYYVFGTMAITFVFGTAAGYILCQIFNQVGVFGKLHYTFPFLQVLLFFAVLVVIALIYSTLAIRYCHKQSLVDRIKTME